MLAITFGRICDLLAAQGVTAGFIFSAFAADGGDGFFQGCGYVDAETGKA